MKNIVRFAALVFAFGTSSAVIAQTELKPGLWEHSFDVSSQSGQIEAAMERAKQMLESLPPEQRAMIEEQMAASGIGFDFDSYTTRVCITEAQAARNQFPQPSEDCSQEVLEQSDDVFRVRFSCAGNPPATGEGEMRIISDEEYRGKVTIDTQVEGQSDQIIASQNGSWVAEDCGSVSPIQN